MTRAWERWEDYAAGMFSDGNDPDTIAEAAALLSDPDAFADAASEMLRSWPEAAYHNLRLIPTGQLAWIGHATCCYALGAKRAETCTAWGFLSTSQQFVANEVAKSCRSTWEARLAETLFAD